MNELTQIEPTEATAAQLPDVAKPERAIAAGSTAQITKAIAAVMRDIDVVAKRGVNQFHRYKYASMQDILQQITPLLGKHGLAIFQDEVERSMFDQEGVIAIKYTFTVAHESGEIWPHLLHQTGVSRCRDSKGGWDDKSLNKCHTAARKYFLLSLFQIPTGEEDDADRGGSNGGEKLKSVYASKPIAAEIKAAFLACKSIDQLFALGDEKAPIIGTLNVLCQDDIRETFATHRKNLRIDGKYHGQPASEHTETTDPETGEVTDQVIWEETGERPATPEEISDSVRSPLNRDVHPHKPPASEPENASAHSAPGIEGHQVGHEWKGSRERPAPDPLDIPDNLKRLTPKEEAVWLDLLRSVAAAAPNVQTMMDLQAEHMGATMQRKVSPRVWLDGVLIFRERVQWLMDNPVFDAETWLVNDLAGALSGAETPLQLAQVKDRMLIPRKDELSPDQWRVAVKLYRSRLDEISPENILGGG